MFAWRFWYNDVLPFAALVTAECALVGVNILYKAASLTGLSFYAFIFYSYVFSALFLLPFAFIFRSSAAVPSVKQPLILRICLLEFWVLLGFYLMFLDIRVNSTVLQLYLRRWETSYLHLPSHYRSFSGVPSFSPFFF